jgi:hypothetical protein
LVTDYLNQFFQELERIKPRDSWAVSHGIAFHEGPLCVLISIGDVRARIAIDKFDPDPLKAAEGVVRKLKSMSLDEMKKVIE